MLSGLYAFAYAAGLAYAAPLLFRRSESVADRLASLIILGVALPGVLAVLHALYPAVLWVSLGALCLVRTRILPPRFAAPDPAVYAVLAGTLIVLWPPLVRPLLDGDSLLYHLPNAAAFVQAHSVWTASAPYWLYPPGSELFAAGLFAASGRWALPLAGMVPALLLAARIYHQSRDCGTARYAAAAIALAFICTPVAAFEAGTLQNDLWLAAFVVEILTAADTSWASFAMCALIKPFGWAEAIIAAVAARAPLRNVVLGLIPLAFWIARDAVLLARGDSSGFTMPAYFSSTLAGNASAGFAALAHGIADTSPQSFLWIAVLIAGASSREARRYAFAGLALLVLYAFLPLSYSGGAANYAVDASSWRFALAALACGALVLGATVRRTGLFGAVLVYAIALWGAEHVLAVFWNDAYTRWALLAVIPALAASAAAVKTRGISIAAASLALLLFGAWAAATRAPDFYADWMRESGGKPTRVFEWIARHQPPRIVAENLRVGAIIMSSPRTLAETALPGRGCARAARERALMLVGTNEGLSAAETAREFTAARSCGTVLYEDRAAVLVEPQ